MAIDRGPWNALVDDDGSNLVGSVWNKAAIKTVILDPVDAAFTAVWQAYAVQWQTNAGYPAIGDGVLEGRYALDGKTCHVTIYVQFGSTTTPGAGAYYSWSLPFPARSMNGLAGFSVAHNAAGGSGQAPGITYPLSTSVVIGVATNGGLFSPITPITWAAGYSITIRGSYELP